jgi:SPP1 gp7 family putative phage head morphogenesis protein
MTPKQLSDLIRKFLIRAEKRSALLLLKEFDEIREELAAFLIKSGVSIADLEDVLVEAEKQIAKRVVRFSTVVGDAQRHVIRETSKALNVFFESSIFDPDKEAIKQLVGRTQTGSSLKKFFLDRLSVSMRAEAKKALIDGFTEGLGAREIASRLKDAADVPYTRALTISRTETNEAYRAASREFYQDAGVKKYVWMAVLDHRTCAICWNLHGRIFNSNRKVFSHPNCRCVLVPLTGDHKAIEAGSIRFAKLEPGFQKQILGPGRYDLYKSGIDLGAFIGSKKDEEFGLRHFIKPLSSLE